MIMIMILVLILKFESTKKRLFCNFVNKYVEYVAVEKCCSLQLQYIATV